MHYVVTGGAGFIGSNLTRALFRQFPDALVTCIDNFDPFYSEKIKRQQLAQVEDLPGFRLLETDISTQSPAQLLEQIQTPVDVIIHLAARAGVRPSIADPEGYVRSNILGLQHMLDFARLGGVRQFVFASSSSVYGVNPHLPWKEEEKLMPISPYAMTKLSGEMMGQVYQHLYGIRFLALRFFTVYGPGQRPDLAIHQFVRKIAQGQSIRMFGDGSTSRDYTYIDDVVAGIIEATRYGRSSFEIINIGNHDTISLRDLITAIEKVTGKEAVIQQAPEQPGDVPHTYASINKAGQLLGYAPHTNIQEGLRKFYQWYLDHEQLLLRETS